MNDPLYNGLKSLVDTVLALTTGAGVSGEQHQALIEFKADIEKADAEFSSGGDPVMDVPKRVEIGTQGLADHVSGPAPVPILNEPHVGSGTAAAEANKWSKDGGYFPDGVPTPTGSNAVNL